MAFQTVVTYGTSTHFTYDATLIEVTGGTIRLLDLGGATYSTSNPAITCQFRMPMRALTTFAESASKPAGSEIKYQVIINDVAYWYNSSTNWEAATANTYTYANTATELNAQASTLFSALSISGNNWIRLRVFLSSTSGSARPTLTSNTLTFTHLEATPDTIAECLIYAYLSDLLGAAYVLDATYPVKLWVKNDHAFWHGNKMILPFAESVTFNSSGYAELSIVETETPAEKLDFFLTFYEGPSLKSVKLGKAQVPNTATRALSQISSVDPTDFG